MLEAHENHSTSYDYNYIYDYFYWKGNSILPVYDVHSRHLNLTKGSQ